jgi:amino acid permease
MLGVYTLSLGKGIGMIFYNVHICLPQWTLIGCIVVLPFVASARKLGAWKSLIWINCASILATVMIPLAVMARQGVEETRIPGSEVYAVAELSLGNAMSGLNIMLFSFTSQFMIVEIMSEMKDPAEFPKAYAVYSAPFQGVAFLLCGLGGYYFRGDLITGIIADHIPFGTWFQMAAGCLIIHMIITWVIKGIVFCNAMQRACFPSAVDDGTQQGWIIWGLCILFILACSYLIAQIVPFFVDLIDLLGASFMPVVCFMIPMAMYARWLQDFGKEEDRISNIEWAIIALEFALAAMMLFVGVYLAVNNIVNSWHTYGYPFECHCENLWNTCACSGSHAGMRHCTVDTA